MPSGEEKQTLALLRRCDVLSDISAEALQALLPGITMGSYRPRQVIYLPGDRAQGIHFLAQGRIKISKVTRDGKELTLAYRTEGDFFGEPCLLDGGPREEMAEAMDASTTVEIGRELLDGLLKTDGARLLQVRARADLAPQGSGNARRAADLQGRRREARRAAAEPRPGARHRRTSTAPPSASRSRTRRWRT